MFSVLIASKSVFAESLCDLQLKHPLNVERCDGIWQLHRVKESFRYQITGENRKNFFLKNGLKEKMILVCEAEAFSRHLAVKGNWALVVVMLHRTACDTRVTSWVSTSSSHYWCIYDCIQDTQPPWGWSIPESRARWNHTQHVFVSGMKNGFYSKHPAVVQKDEILTEWCLFIKTLESSGRLGAFGYCKGTTSSSCFVLLWVPQTELKLWIWGWQVHD